VASVAALPRPPSKKAIQAAVAAMEAKGFKTPVGMQMVISFAPGPNPQVQQPRQQQQKKESNTAASKRNSRGRGRGPNGPTTQN
jgi:hypothetical protein